MESLYRGVPLAELRIESVEWTEERAQHIRTRSARKGMIELDVSPNGPQKPFLTKGGLLPLHPVTPSRSSGTPRRLGTLLKVWLYPKDLMAGDRWGASACEANTTDKRNYKEANK